MRKMAQIANSQTEVKRVILYEADDGAYIFLFAMDADGPADGDQWFESTSEAEDYCTEQFRIERGDWQVICDPAPGCQHDWIAQVRVKRDIAGAPLWGQYERSENGAWVDVV